MPGQDRDRQALRLRRSVVADKGPRSGFSAHSETDVAREMTATSNQDFFGSTQEIQK